MLLPASQCVSQNCWSMSGYCTSPWAQKEPRLFWYFQSIPRKKKKKKKNLKSKDDPQRGSRDFDHFDKTGNFKLQWLIRNICHLQSDSWTERRSILDFIHNLAVAQNHSPIEIVMRTKTVICFLQHHSSMSSQGIWLHCSSFYYMPMSVEWQEDSLYHRCKEGRDWCWRSRKYLLINREWSAADWTHHFHFPIALFRLDTLPCPSATRINFLLFSLLKIGF